MKARFISAAINLPIDGLFSYSVPEALSGEVSIGKRVVVPFGKRTVTAYVVAITDEPGVRDVKELIDIIDQRPIFDERRLKFFKWVSSYYFSPLGMVLALIHPSSTSVKSKRRLAIAGAGRLALDNGEVHGLDHEVLSAIKKETALAALSMRFKGRPLNSTLNRLEKKGYLTSMMHLKGQGRPKTERLLRLVRRDIPVSGEAFKRAPLQAGIYERLLERGEAPVRAFIEEFGAIDGALKRLERAGLVEITVRESRRDPLSTTAPKESGFEPNACQAEAIKEITSALDKGGFSPFLLYGVTGSGKTLVYLNVIEEAVKRGRRAIFLVPEIALTPWPAAYLKERFPGRVAILHSGLGEGERFDEWQRIVKDEADVVVGARSALFSPLGCLGLIIVDEEHEASYKQEDGVRYNARDSAIKLGQTLGITVVLGSATPSVETFYNSKTGKLRLLTLKNRIDGTTLPDVEIVDMKGRKREVFSERLSGLLADALSRKEQALLFINRRGFSSTLMCRDCGHGYPCLNCSVTLTLHKRPSPGSLKCHYCDMAMPLPGACPACNGVNLIEPGMGTEKVEAEVNALHPGARTLRMDRDSTSRAGSIKEMIDAVEERRADVLVGTQMASKGHHFPGITLVGVISGDVALNIPDFRSAERTFQLVTQAAGRAGRGRSPGKVVMQTLNPGHYVYRAAERHDYDWFFEEELRYRKEVFYPPFSRLCSMRVDAVKEAKAIEAARYLKEAGEAFLRRHRCGVVVLGPSPMLISRLKGRHRWHMLLKGDAKNIAGLHALVSALRAAFEARTPSGARLTVDMDPVNMV